jgi:prevent-host-death family protein
MEEIAISKFKATCLGVLERVNKTRQPVLVTKFGRPIAEIVPVTPANLEGSWVGGMVGTGRIVGDIVSPAADEEDWDALR